MTHINAIGLANPGHPIAQTDLLKIAQRHNANDDNDAQQARLKRLYRSSTIQHRHSVLADHALLAEQAYQHLADFYDHPHARGPSTHERMRIYDDRAASLSAQACNNAFKNSDLDAQDITQLITVSCTGFAAPGQDAGLVAALGLRTTVGRTHIGFMGCHAAINALRIADAFIRADPAQRVLVCCTELCTLHFQFGYDPQDAIANALFADGSAALIATGNDTAAHAWRPRSFHAEHLPDTRDMMGWHIGDHGFKMRLDPKVPDAIQRTLRPSITHWLAQHDLRLQDIAGWAIHPGGPKIIDAVQHTLDLPPAASQPSRDTLASLGNMSSPTVIFIIDQLIRQRTPKPWVALGFGPGLAIEAVLIV